MPAQQGSTWRLHRRENAAALIAPMHLALVGGDTAGIVIRVLFNADGAMVGASGVCSVGVPLPGAAETKRLVDGIGARLGRSPAIGLTELRRRAEATLAVLDHLEALEASHGDAARQLLRDAGA